MQSAAEKMLDVPLGRQLFGVSAIAMAAWWWDGDWCIAAAIVSLWVIWAIVPAGDGPPVLALALTFQWMQSCIGVLYAAATGRAVRALLTPDYRTVILISLGCILALAIGLRIGVRWWWTDDDDENEHASVRVGWLLILASYAIPTVLETTLMDYAFTYLSIGQAIIAVRFVRLAALYLILRRCIEADRWVLFGGIVLLELGLSLTSYYAGFREPLVIAIAAISERFHPRNLAQAVSLVAIAIVGSLMGLAWLGVRDSYRADYDSDLVEQSRAARTSRLTDLGREFFRSDSEEMLESTDELIDRMWTIYYPSLAYARVPAVLPHTDGTMLLTALQHVTMPRILFPDKPALASDSELVRRYAGVWVAGEEQNTSIAFGYMIESYIDFGVPAMFVPSLIWGVFLGVAYSWFHRQIHTHELRVGLLMVIFWIALYLFERSWAKTMGTSGTLMIYLGLPTLILDRVLIHRAQDDPPSSVVIGDRSTPAHI